MTGTNDDKDTITDLTAAGDDHDIIDLSKSPSIEDFRDFKAHHLSEHDSDVWIDAGHGDVLVLKNIHIADLGKNDFLF